MKANSSPSVFRSCGKGGSCKSSAPSIQLSTRSAERPTDALASIIVTRSRTSLARYHRRSPASSSTAPSKPNPTNGRTARKLTRMTVATKIATAASTQNPASTLPM